MKILQVCPYDMSRPGGVQSHIRDLAAWLQSQGHDVLVLAPPPKHNIALADNVLTVGRAKAISLHGTGFEISFALPGELRNLTRTLADWRADVLHLHTPWTPFLPWQVWRRTKLPTVTTFHATLPDQAQKQLLSAGLRRVAAYFMRRTDGLIVPSTAPLSQLRNLVADVQPRVLPPAIDLTGWRQAGAKRDSDNSCPLELIFLGRLEARKGVDVLLAAWAQLSHALPDVRLTIAGSGPMQDQVEKAVASCPDGRLNHVPQPDPRQARALVAKADIFVAPSPYGESFGIVLIEAMAAGTVPVAAANTGYETVMTGPGRTLLVPPNDASALSKRILALAKAPEELQELRAWGQSHAAGFDISQVGPGYVDVFKDALKSASQV